MKYPYAEKGSRIIMFAEVFAIFTILLSALSLFLLTGFITGSFDIEQNIVNSSFFVGLMCGIIGIVFQVLTSILSVIGYYFASKDEKEFKKAMVCSLASGLLAVFGMVFQFPNATLSTILSSASTIVEMFVMVFAMTGMIGLAEHEKLSERVKKGNVLLSVLVVTFFVSAMNALIIRIFSHNEGAFAIVLEIEAAKLVLSILQHLFYMIYLRRTAKKLSLVIQG